jgi:hypothetical protein
VSRAFWTIWNLAASRNLLHPREFRQHRVHRAVRLPRVDEGLFRGGLSVEETAEALGVSGDTVKRD